MANNNSVVIDLLLQDAKFKLSIERAQDGVKDLKREVDKSNGAVDDLKNGFDKLKGGLGKVVDSVFSLKGALAAAASFIAFDKIIDAAIEADSAVQSVANSLRLSGEYSAEALAEVQTFAGQLQDMTGIGDDTTLSMISLAQSFGLNKDQAKDVVKVAADLSAATGQDLTTAVNNLSAAYNGQVGKLGKLNPALKELTEQQLKAGVALEILGAQFEGSAASKLQTFGGALDAAKGRFGDLIEEIGFLVTRNPAIIEAIRRLEGVIKGLIEIVANNADTIRKNLTTVLVESIRSFAKAARALLLFGEALTTVGKLLGIGGFADDAEKANTALEKQRGLVTDVVRGFVLMATGITEARKALLEIDSKTRDKIGIGIFGGGAGSADEEKKKIDETLTSLKNIRKELELVPFTNGSPLKSLTGDLKSLQSPADKFLAALNEIADTLEGLPSTIDLGAGKKGGGGGGGGDKWTVKGNAAEFGPGRELMADQLDPAKNLADEFDESINAIADNFVTEFGKVSKQIAGALFTNVLQGKEGARKFLGAAAGAITDVFAPGMGAAVAPFVEALTQGKEVVKAQVEAFAEALPELIDALVEAIPVFVQTLADNADEIIIALANGMPKVAAALAIALANPQLYLGVARELAKAAAEGLKYQIEQLRNAIGVAAEQIKAMPAIISEGFKVGMDQAAEKIKLAAGKFAEDVKTGAKKFVDDIVSEAGRFIDKLVEEIKGALPSFSGGGRSGGRGGLEEATGTDIPYVSVATGGLVTGAGNRDTVPAMLSPGELVLDRTTGPRLNAFLNEQTRGAAQQAPADSSLTLTLLAQIVDLLQRPMTVNTTAEVDGRTLADIVLELTRTNQRLTA
jgi:hypothetical protein